MQVFHSQSLHHTASWISILAPQDAAISRYQTCILRCVYPEVSQGTGISGRRWSILGYRRPEVRLWHLETRAPWQHPELRKAYLDRLFEGTCWYLRLRVTWDAETPTSGRYNVPVTVPPHLYRIPVGLHLVCSSSPFSHRHVFRGESARMNGKGASVMPAASQAC